MEHYKNLLLDNIIKEIEGIVYTENWKDMVGYEDLYRISDFGRIKTYKKPVSRGKNGKGIFIQKERILKLGLTKNGYLHTTFYKEGTKKTIKIHTLVWDHFGDRLRDGFVLQVDHKDEIKTNNWIGNLRLLKSRDNLIRNFKNHPLLLGVRKCDSKFQARIYIKGKRNILGTFKTEIEAHNAYLKAKECA